jgi:rRNA-processing protein FCF1
MPGTPSGHRSTRSPLEGTTRLLVDGTNLLYRIGQGGSTASRGAAPPAAIIGRLRAAIPGTVTIDLVFDGVGHGVFGRVAQGMTVRYAGRRTGDDVILDLTSEAAMQAGSGPTGATHVLAVTNDRELRERLHVKGARTVPLQWLMNRLDLPVMASAAAGNKRAPVGIGSPGSSPNHGNPSGDDNDRPAWKPGRGATTKTGPARKVARHKRHPRHDAPI